ncbi:MAG: HEAT repeat domain-containing protein [Planctomycetes bacterium]|nr:HEAT repeat domain-containing protein [Planctomycetota bacterium]
MTKLPETIPANELKYWISMFGKSSMNVRLELTKKILMHGKIAIPHLIEGLSDKIWSVRQDCANALAEIGDERAIEPLKKTLFDQEKGVRFESARAISKIGSEEDKQLLLKLAKETLDDDFRHFLYDCLTGSI